MTLGLYGTPHSIRVVKVAPARVTCPLEVYGIPDVEVRFENFWNTWWKPSIPKNKIPARPGWKYYAGRCISSPAYPDSLPPMIPVLATITILETRLLVPHYMTES